MIFLTALGYVVGVPITAYLLAKFTDLNMDIDEGIVITWAVLWPLTSIIALLYLLLVVPSMWAFEKGKK